MQTGELSERQEAPGINLITHDQSPVVVQPGDRPLHLPSVSVALQRSAILSRRPLATLPVGTDQLDAIRRAFSERIRVSRPVVDQTDRMLAQDMTIQKRLDQRHLRRTGAVNIHCQGKSLPVDEQHQLAALASFGGANVRTPFFADANVASAIAVRRSIRPLA